MKTTNNFFAQVRKIAAQAAALMLLLVVTLSCERTEKPPPLSSETEILSVIADGLIDVWMRVETGPEWVDDFKGGTHSSVTFIALTVSYETDRATLTPQFIVSPGASIARVDRIVTDVNGQVVEQTYLGQVHYIITAEDGITTSYVIAAAIHPIIRQEAITRQTSNSVFIYSRGNGSTTPWGTHPHIHSAKLHIAATPHTFRYKLSAWYVNRERRSTEPNFFYVVAPGDTIRAVFDRAPAVQLTVRSQDTRMGTASGSRTASSGDIVTITATPSSGFAFIGWYIDNVRVTAQWGTNPNATFTFISSQDVTVVARFMERPTICGPTTIGGDQIGTFTVNAPPGLGATVSWTRGDGLSLVSATGRSATFRATGYYSGWIRATVNGVQSPIHAVTIKRPPFAHMRIGNPYSHDPFSRNLCRNINHTLVVYSVINQYERVGRFYWHFGAWRQYITGFRPSWRGIDNAVVNFRLSNNATFVQVISVQVLAPGELPPSDFDLPITFIGDTFFVVNCFGRDLPLTVEHPNPVSSILPIQLVPHPQLALARNMRNAFGFQYNVRLYDREGNVVRQLATEKEQFQLDVSDLPDGYYFLHILDEGIDAPIVQQIIVRNRH